jgi:hypothetical protein
MENYIDLINAYLNQSLSQQDMIAFENRLETDIEFNSIYNEHIFILKGIERSELKEDLSKAKQSYIRRKWAKYLGISILVVLSIILVISLFSNKKELKESTGVSEVENFVIDSSHIKNDEIKEYVVIKYVKKVIKIEELTELYGGVEVVKDTIIKMFLGLYTKNAFESEFQNVVDFETRNDTIIINSNLKELEDNSELNKDEDNNFVEVPKAVFKSVKKQSQIIKVNVEEGIKTTLKEGTKISIPENAFVNERTGKNISGEIDLRITEYYKLSDILLADLTTKSDNKLLETGGMLYINATQKGVRLKLNQQKPLHIIFNNSGKPNMQLFEGFKTDDNGINWKLNTEIEAVEIDELTDDLTSEAAAVQEVIEESFVRIKDVEEGPVFPGCESGNNEERKECMKDAINKLVNRKFNTSIAGDLELTGRQSIRTSFEIDAEGIIGKIEARASHKELAEEAIRVIELMPKLIPAKQKGKAVAISYYLPINFQTEGETMDQPSITIKSDKAFIKRFGEKSTSEIGNSDIERYTFATTNLGWINCDRFVNSIKKKIKYKIKIKDAEGANVKMVFKSISSVLPSNKNNNQYNFGEVPLDENIILLAVKRKGDKLYLGMIALKTKAISELDLNFKEVTLNELKTELQKLNKGFN